MLIELNENELKVVKNVLARMNEAEEPEGDSKIQAIIEDLASRTSNDPEDAEYDVDGNEITISFGGEEYRVFDSYEAAEDAAVEMEYQLLDDMGFEAGVRMKYLGNDYKDYLDDSQLSEEELDELDELISDWSDADEVKQYINKDFIDWRGMAEDVVNTDGPANGLATYDGDEIELDNGYYAYRVN